MGHSLVHKCCTHSVHHVMTVITIGSTIRGEDVAAFGKVCGKGMEGSM